MKRRAEERGGGSEFDVQKERGEEKRGGRGSGGQKERRGKERREGQRYDGKDNFLWSREPNSL